MSTLFDKFKERSIRESLRYLIFNTRVEIVAGLVTAGTIAGVLSYRDNKKQEAHIPLAFSEIESITRKFEEKGQKVPALTHEYAVINDFAMKIFESSNDALSQNESNATFARELQKHMEENVVDHNSIGEYAKAFPSISREAIQSLKGPINASKELPAVVNAFDAVWDESHYDHYHTEVYYTTECTGSGKTRHCGPKRHTKKVYDYTTHTYTFHPEEAAQAERLLQAFLNKYPDINISQLVRATETGEANQNAMRKSMADFFKKNFKDKQPEAADYLKLANTWATASNFTEYFPAIRQSHAELKRLSGAWSWSAKDARSTSYTTYRRSDSGPREFQIVEEIVSNGIRMGQNTSDITKGIALASRQVPELNNKINEFIDVSLNGKPGNADKLRTEILDGARDVYKANFERGFDVYPFKWGIVVLLTLAGMAIGAAAGAGADHLLNKYEERRMTREQIEEKHRKEEEKLKKRRLFL